MPIYTKTMFPSFDRRKTEEAQQEKGIKERYAEHVNQVITVRLKVMMLAGGFLYIAFHLLDRVIYPEVARTFLLIRATVSLIMIASFGLTFIPAVQKRIIWLNASILYVCALGIILMTFLTDGLASGYREGVTLVFFALLFTNSFDLKSNIYFCLAVVVSYFILCSIHNPNWELADFSKPMFFSGGVIFFVLIMTGVYSKQNYEQFQMAEKIRENEKKLEQSYEQAKAEAERDQLTQVYNRTTFFKIVEKKIEYCRAKGKSFYLVFFDIDQLKHLNDSYGHLVGDEIIRTVTTEVRRNLRSDTEMGRFGGDEFTFIIDEAATHLFYQRIEEIREAIAKLRFDVQGKQVTVSASFGAAKFDPMRMRDLKELLLMADHAALYSKRTKRGGVHLANPDK